MLRRRLIVGPSATPGYTPLSGPCFGIWSARVFISAKAVNNKIDTLETKRNALEQQLAAPGIDKDERIAIRRNLDTIGNEITALITASSSASAAPLLWEREPYAEVASARSISIGGNTKDPTSGIEIIEKASPWFGLEGSSEHLLVVREWHRVFWERYAPHLHKRAHRVAIIGTPGIGKTVALNYLLWKLLGDANAMGSRRYVAVVLPKSKSCLAFDTKEKVCAASTKTTVEQAFESVIEHIDPNSNQSIYLHDLIAGNRDPLVSHYRPTVLATSLGNRQFDHFLKGSNSGGPPTHFYAPLLEQGEMEFVAEHVWPERKEGWRDRAAMVGNVPRLVFAYHERDMQEWVKVTNNNIKSLSADVLMQYIRGDFKVGVTDRFLAVQPSSDYCTHDFVTRSPWVSDEMARVAQRSHLETAWRGLVYSLDGAAFERALMLVLRKDSAAVQWDSMEALVNEDHSSSAPPPSTALMDHVRSTLQALGKQPAVFFQRSESGVRRHLSKLYIGGYQNAHARLYVPFDVPNFPLVDAFTFVQFENDVLLIGLQATVGREHPPSASTLGKFIDEFNDETKSELVFGNINDEKRIRIDVDKNGFASLSLGDDKAPRKLRFVTVYLTNSGWFDKRQKIKNESEAPAKWKNFWDRSMQLRLDFTGENARTNKHLTNADGGRA